ncbi:MAG TPA: hypothetical protein VGG72_07575 [Bryobacteraceae bacterium]|jgi:hypothetical protein
MPTNTPVTPQPDNTPSEALASAATAAGAPTVRTFVLLTIAFLFVLMLAITFFSNGESVPDPGIDHKVSALSDIERNCLGMYLKYGDSSASSLTVNQAQGVEACQALGLFHDLR